MRFPKLKQISEIADLIAMGALAIISIAVLSVTGGTVGFNKFLAAEKARQETAIRLANKDLAERHAEFVVLQKLVADQIALKGRQKNTRDRLVHEKLDVDRATARSRLEIANMAALIERSSQANVQTKKNITRMYALQFYEAVQNALIDESVYFAETTERYAGTTAHIGHAVLQDIERRMELSADQNAAVRDQEFLAEMNSRCPKIWDFDLYIDPLPGLPKPGVQEMQLEFVSHDALDRWNDTQRVRTHKLAEFSNRARECACRTLFAVSGGDQDKCEQARLIYR